MTTWAMADSQDGGVDLLDRPLKGRLVAAAEFQRLLVSNRRMERFSSGQPRLRGLRDLDTGEVYLTDERRLFESCR